MLSAFPRRAFPRRLMKQERERRAHNHQPEPSVRRQIHAVEITMQVLRVVKDFLLDGRCIISLYYKMF